MQLDPNLRLNIDQVISNFFDQITGLKKSIRQMNLSLYTPMTYLCHTKHYRTVTLKFA